MPSLSRRETRHATIPDESWQSVTFHTVRSVEERMECSRKRRASLSLSGDSAKETRRFEEKHSRKKKLCAEEKWTSFSSVDVVPVSKIMRRE